MAGFENQLFCLIQKKCKIRGKPVSNSRKMQGFFPIFTSEKSLPGKVSKQAQLE